jgi:Fe-S cluster assembly protein SufB
VEVFVKKNARARYSSVENWSRNTYNLNTKRAIVDENATIEWVGGNLGSGVTMLYPCSMLRGKGSRAENISIAFAARGQNQDTGAKVYHLAPKTTSHITSKSIAVEGGITTYRGLVKIRRGATGAKSAVECDALMIDNISQSNTYPFIDVKEADSDVGHEATVGRISDDDVFYLMSRGIKEEEAKKMIVNGFIEPVTKQLPLEYAVELNKLIELEMEGSLG